MLKLSTKGRYAIRAMLDLALQTRENPIIIKDISKRQDISDLYLEQLFNRLKAAGLVRSTRGPKGGFTLTRSPSLITLGDILQAMEGSTAPVECVDNAQVCSRSDSCVTRKVWAAVKKSMDEVLESTTLKDLVNQEKENHLEAQEAQAGIKRL